MDKDNKIWRLHVHIQPYRFDDTWDTFDYLFMKSDATELEKYAQKLEDRLNQAVTDGVDNFSVYLSRTEIVDAKSFTAVGSEESLDIIFQNLFDELKVYAADYLEQYADEDVSVKVDNDIDFLS